MLALYNKGKSDGPSAGVARLAWALMGVSFALWVRGGVDGMLYCLEHGTVTGQSRGGGSAAFQRAEHHIFFWITFLALTAGLGVFAFFALMCFWKALDRKTLNKVAKTGARYTRGEVDE